MPSPEPTQPPADRPNPFGDDAGPYAQQAIDARGRGEGASILFAAIAVAVHALLLGATIVGTMIVGARCEKAFRDFNMKLDDFTAFALGVSRWLNHYWYVLVVFLIPCFLAAGGPGRCTRGWRSASGRRRSCSAQKSRVRTRTRSSSRCW